VHKVDDHCRWAVSPSVLQVLHTHLLITSSQVDCKLAVKLIIIKKKCLAYYSFQGIKSEDMFVNISNPE
jgi:hypothetical protein